MKAPKGKGKGKGGRKGDATSPVAYAQDWGFATVPPENISEHLYGGEPISVTRLREGV